MPNNGIHELSWVRETMGNREDYSNRVIDFIVLLSRVTQSARFFPSMIPSVRIVKNGFVSEQAGGPMTHGWNQTRNRVLRCSSLGFSFVFPDASPHLVLKWRILVPPTGKFHASAQLFMLMLPHFFASFFDDTRHSHSFFSSAEDENFSLIGVSLTAKRRVSNTEMRNFTGSTVFLEVSRQCAGSVPVRRQTAFGSGKLLQGES